MRTVPLHGKKAAGRVALVDDADYELVMRYRWFVWERTMAGGTKQGPYATANLPGAHTGTVRMHRLLIPEGSRVDLRDGDGLNNQRSNLRPASKGQNMANSRKSNAAGGVAPSSRFKGVTWDKDRRLWRAEITAHGIGRNLGRFVREELAARAYDTAARAAFGEFAKVNFP
jgi:hypothetical protein